MDAATQFDAMLEHATDTLTAAETINRLRELEAWGVDLSLVRANLQRTPTDRLRQNAALASMVRQMEEGMLKLQKSGSSGGQPTTDGTIRPVVARTDGSA